MNIRFLLAAFYPKSTISALLTPDHGEDWALAAVELAAQTSDWAKGQI